jgi:hypothetical protein
MQDDGSSDSAVPPWASADSLGFRVARRHDWIGAMQPITGGRPPVDAAPAAIYRRHEAFARGMVARAARPGAGSERWPIVVPAQQVRRRTPVPAGIAEADPSAATHAVPVEAETLPAPVEVGRAGPRPALRAAAIPWRGDAPEQAAGVEAADVPPEDTAAQTRVPDAVGVAAQTATGPEPASLSLGGAASSAAVTAAAADGHPARHLMRAGGPAAHPLAMPTATPSMRAPSATSSSAPVARAIAASAPAAAMPPAQADRPSATSSSAPVARAITTSAPVAAMPPAQADLPAGSPMAARAEGGRTHRAASAPTAGTVAMEAGAAAMEAGTVAMEAGARDEGLCLARRRVAAGRIPWWTTGGCRRSRRLGPRRSRLGSPPRRRRPRRPARPRLPSRCRLHRRRIPPGASQPLRARRRLLSSWRVCQGLSS